MSNSASDPLPSGYSILGGIPLPGQDHAASIIFLVAFAILLFGTLFRYTRSTSRTTALLRPVAFDLLRIITYGLRYKQASGDYSVGLFIATQVMFSLGLLFMGEPVLALLNEAAKRGVSRGSGGGPGLLRFVGTFQIRLVILAAVAVGIYGGVLVGHAIHDPSDLNNVKTMRYVNSGLSIGACVMIIFIGITNGLPLNAMAFVVLVAGMLLINSVYKLVIVAHPADVISSGTKAGFYLLFALPEFIAALAFPVFNLRSLFGMDGPEGKDGYPMA